LKTKTRSLKKLEELEKYICLLQIGNKYDGKCQIFVYCQKLSGIWSTIQLIDATCHKEHDGKQFVAEK
jgi:hypothetical protein